MEKESGMGWIEDPTELNLLIDNLDFQEIEDLSIEKVKKELVYDLEVDSQHNYMVDSLGIVHNGGGK